jgi:hypothetical protein
LAIVIVKRSLEAANAIIAGNNVNLIASLNMTPSDFVCFPDYAMEIESALPIVSPPPVGKTKKAPSCRRSLLLPSHGRRQRLFERVGNGGEGPIQVLAETLDNGDDGNRDAGGDKAIFNGGRAGFVFEETREDGLHWGGS